MFTCWQTCDVCKHRTSIWTNWGTEQTRLTEVHKNLTSSFRPSIFTAVTRRFLPTPAANLIQSHPPSHTLILQNPLQLYLPQTSHVTCILPTCSPVKLWYSLEENEWAVKTSQCLSHARGRDSSVGIATRYGLHGPGIESRWGRDFPHPSRPPWGPHSLLYNGYRVFPGGKAAGVWCWPPTPT